jgi:hypothetical protein
MRLERRSPSILDSAVIGAGVDPLTVFFPAGVVFFFMFAGKFGKEAVGEWLANFASSPLMN